MARTTSACSNCPGDFIAEGRFGRAFRDRYLVPMAAEMPDIIIDHVETPVTGTLLGAKGIGEAGTIGAAAVGKRPIIVGGLSTARSGGWLGI